MPTIDEDIIDELLHIDGMLEGLMYRIRMRRNNALNKRELRKICNNLDTAYMAIRKAIEIADNS